MTDEEFKAELTLFGGQVEQKKLSESLTLMRDVYLQLNGEGWVLRAVGVL